MSSEFGEVTMTINPEMEYLFRDTLNLDIEMMQGTREELPNGQVKYSFKIYDDQKNEMVKEFALKMISHSHIKENKN